MAFEHLFLLGGCEFEQTNLGVGGGVWGGGGWGGGVWGGGGGGWEEGVDDSN